MDTVNEIECRDCDGNGERLLNWTFQNRRHRTVEQCPACNGHGWRAPTDDESAEIAENAFSDMCEGEPPLSFAEKSAAQAKREAQWGVR